jgi:hypothetical protein
MSDYDPEINVPNFVKQFVIAVRRRASQDEYFLATTDKSRVKLIIELSSRLTNKANRKSVLQAITGIPLQSQNQLTQWYTSAIIDEVINVSLSYPGTVAFIEKLVEKPTGFKAWDLFPWDKPHNTDLPVLPKDDPG